MTIKLLAFSDWRTQELTDVFKFVRTLTKPIDLILYAGDDVRRFEELGVNYFAKLSQYSKQRKVLAVIGNDDSPDVKEVLNSEGVFDLHEKPLIVKGFAFIGLEGSTKGPATVRYSEGEVKEHLDKQYRRVGKDAEKLIVLSHTPPHGFLDLGIRFANLDEDSHHIGSKSLKDFIQRKEVDLVVCGHCHSHGGLSTRSEGTTIVNVSSHDSPGSVGNFALIELGHATGSVRVEWHSTFELIRRESLTYLHGVGVSRESTLRTLGIRTIDDLAEAEIEDIASGSSLSLNSLRKLKLEARSVLKNRIYQINPFSPPETDLIFFDIETDLACRRVWLIGVLKDSRFYRFYADNWNRERRILKAFLRLLNESPLDSTLVTYSCTNFDKRVIEGALHRAGLEMDPFSDRSHIDLGIEFRRSFVFPNQSFALKDLGAYLGYPFKHSELDGFHVALEYEQHLEEGRPLDPQVIEYNEDDVRVLPYMINQLTEDRLRIHKVGLDGSRPVKWARKER